MDSRAGGGQKESGVLDSVALAMRVYKELHGQTPKTWAEVSTILNLEDLNRLMKQVYGYRLEDRYQFVTGNVPMYGNAGAAFEIEDGSRILVSRVTPYLATSWGLKPIRAFIYQDKKGEIWRAFVREERVQTLFRDSGFALPLPAGVPELESELVNAGAIARSPKYDDAKAVWPPLGKGSSSAVPAIADDHYSNTNANTGSANEWQYRRILGDWRLLAGMGVAVAAVGGWLLVRTKRKKN